MDVRIKPEYEKKYIKYLIKRYGKKRALEFFGNCKLT